MIKSREYITNPSQANPDIKLSGVQFEQNPGAQYGEHIMNTAAICNASASHTYGNVMSVVEKYLCDIFPPDTFKTVIASTTLASRQITHLPHQLQKRELPIMVLVPRISFGQGDDRFLGNTLINSRTTNTHALWGDGSLLPLAEDKRKKLYVHGHYNRAVMFVDVVLSFNTYSEQLNFMSYIHNMIPVDHNQFIRAPLELYIPKEFCNLIGNFVGIPVRDEKDKVYDFLTYMNTMWHYPITYKLNGGSNTDEFFMYYMADIDTEVTDVQAGSGVKDGQIKRAFDITFTIRCDFNTIGYFTLNHPDIKRQIKMSMVEPNRAIVPIFSDVINLNDFDLPLGWSILSWPIFKLKENENSVSLEGVLNQSLTTVIDYHLKMGLPMEKFIRIEFRENGEILHNELYYINWKNRELVLFKPNMRRTYRLIISVNHEYINNLIKDLYNLE